MQRRRQTREIYADRLNRAVDFIQSSLDADVSLHRVAKAAAFSPFHFHRIFKLFTGESLRPFTERVRAEKAVRLLVRKPGMPLTEIAYDCGYSSPSAFSRAIRKLYGTTPRKIRSGGAAEIRKKCKVAADEPEYVRGMQRKPAKNAYSVRVETTPALTLAYVRITRAFEGDRVLDGFRRLLDWGKRHGHLRPGGVIGMSIDDPELTPKEKYRYDACLVVPAGTKPDGIVGIATLPALRCAVVRVSGDAFETDHAINHVYSGWLPDSRYEPADYPCMEVFLDTERILDFSRFELDIRVPIQALRNIKPTRRTKAC